MFSKSEPLRAGTSRSPFWLRLSRDTPLCGYSRFAFKFVVPTCSSQ